MPFVVCVMFKDLNGLLARSRLFKRWTALSTGQVTIQSISIWEANCVMHWIEIYPVDSAIHI